MMPYLAFLFMPFLSSMMIVSGTGKMQIHPRTHSHVLRLFGGLSRGLLGLGRDLGLESWLGGWLIVGLLRRKRCLRRFRLSPLTTLLEFVPSLFCPVELDFLNLVIYRQGGTAIAAESHFPIHVNFKPSTAAWAGKVDDLHENPFRITSSETKIRKSSASFIASRSLFFPCPRE